MLHAGVRLSRIAPRGGTRRKGFTDETRTAGPGCSQEYRSTAYAPLAGDRDCARSCFGELGWVRVWLGGHIGPDVLDGEHFERKLCLWRSEQLRDRRGG